MRELLQFIRASVELAAYKVRFKLDDLVERACEPLRGDLDPFALGDAVEADDPHGLDPELHEVEEFAELVAPAAGFDHETVRRYVEWQLGADLLPWQVRLIDALPVAQAPELPEALR